MAAVSKNVYIDNLDDIINEYKNTFHRTIKMKPIEVKGNTYIDFIKEVNDKDFIFRVGDHIRISKCRNIFAKRYTTNLSVEIFVFKKVKDTVPWAYVINDINGEEIIGAFYQIEIQKTNQQGFMVKKSLKEKEGNHISNAKDMITHLIIGLTNMILYRNESVPS